LSISNFWTVGTNHLFPDDSSTPDGLFPFPSAFIDLMSITDCDDKGPETVVCLFSFISDDHDGISDDRALKAENSTVDDRGGIENWLPTDIPV
jgi:hypothetical protein